MPRTATKPVTRRPRKPAGDSPPSVAREPERTDTLGTFAAKLLIGQACERGCGDPAEWAAVAPSQQRFACTRHLGELLDHHAIWFVHPLEHAHVRAA